MTDIGRCDIDLLRKLRDRSLKVGSADAYEAYDLALRVSATRLRSEIETLRARLAAAERVVEAARTYIMLEWESLDLTALNTQRKYEGLGTIPASEIALGESLAAYDQGKVTICD